VSRDCPKPPPEEIPLIEKPEASTLAEFQAILSEGRYAIKDLPTLKDVLADAFCLYDAMAGKARLSDFLAVIEKQTAPEIFQLIVFDLARFIQPRLAKALAEMFDVQQENTATVADLGAGMVRRRLLAIQKVKQSQAPKGRVQ